VIPVVSKGIRDVYRWVRFTLELFFFPFPLQIQNRRLYDSFSKVFHAKPPINETLNDIATLQKKTVSSDEYKIKSPNRAGPVVCPIRIPE
jgi:hypothetical protein